MKTIPILPLTAAAFAPFGQVIDTLREPLIINGGFARRHNDLCAVDVARGGGETNVSLFVARARFLPLTITMMERHPLGSQAFMPLQDRAWLAVVCTDPGIPDSFRAFAVAGTQGVNYAVNTWHFPLITFTDGDRFLVVDRKGSGDNLEERVLAEDRRPVIAR